MKQTVLYATNNRLEGHWGRSGLQRACLTLNANDITGAEHVDPQGILTPLNLSKADVSCALLASLPIPRCCWSGGKKNERLKGISNLLCNINTTSVLAW